MYGLRLSIEHIKTTFIILVQRYGVKISGINTIIVQFFDLFRRILKNLIPYKSYLYNYEQDKNKNYSNWLSCFFVIERLINLYLHII